MVAAPCSRVCHTSFGAWVERIVMSTVCLSRGMRLKDETVALPGLSEWAGSPRPGTRIRNRPGSDENNADGVGRGRSGILDFDGAVGSGDEVALDALNLARCSAPSRGWPPRGSDQLVKARRFLHRDHHLLSSGQPELIARRGHAQMQASAIDVEKTEDCPVHSLPWRDGNSPRCPGLVHAQGGTRWCCRAKTPQSW